MEERALRLNQKTQTMDESALIMIFREQTALLTENRVEVEC